MARVRRVKPKNRIQFIYVIPSDGVNERLHTNGTIANSVEAFQTWLESQTGGRRLQTDGRGHELDIKFLHLCRSDADLASHGTFLRDQLEAEIHADGFNDPNKIYAVYYGGRSTTACGGGPWPPVLVGNVAAVYLRGEPPNARPCATNQFAGPGGAPGYWEFAMLHEIVHALGFVATCAPHHTLSGHVSDDPRDLMYAGPLAWRPSILDVGADDYYGHGNATCPDLQKSHFLTPSRRKPRLSDPRPLPWPGQ